MDRPRERRDEENLHDREVHVHATTEIRGATVLPTWFIVALILSLTLTMAGSCSGIGILAWKLHDLSGDLKLLEDYAKGRIDHLPYRPERRDP